MSTWNLLIQSMVLQMMSSKYYVHLKYLKITELLLWMHFLPFEPSFHTHLTCLHILSVYVILLIFVMIYMCDWFYIFCRFCGLMSNKIHEMCRCVWYICRGVMCIRNVIAFFYKQKPVEFRYFSSYRSS